ncbi:MAG: hypothetical protein PHD95_05370 [Candidatus ainarchaeum sp.]|nr:hypothetical protein [Candidatus ainarchaeum sp.]
MMIEERKGIAFEYAGLVVVAVVVCALVFFLALSSAQQSPFVSGTPVIPANFNWTLAVQVVVVDLLLYGAMLLCLVKFVFSSGTHKATAKFMEREKKVLEKYFRMKL